MTIRRTRPELSKFSRTGKLRQKSRRVQQRRQMLLEGLETRQLMAVGPQLIGIQPNDNALFVRDRTNILNVSPTELTFRFDENQRFDVNNLRGIQITRAGFDGQFAAAKVSSKFNTDSSDPVEVTFEATRLGLEGNGISLAFTKGNLGTGVAPIITVSGSAINVRLNSTAGSRTTAQGLVDALNRHPEASSLVQSRVTFGNASRDITSPTINYSPLKLAGANDVVVQPGYFAPGDAPNENTLVFRFSERLPDDLYRIDVIGSQPLLALRNNDARCTFNYGGTIVRGCALGDLTEDGLDNGINPAPVYFDLDLGARIEGVVPQPVERVGGVLVQQTNRIDVYFNNDTLQQAAAENPAYYQLIFTNDTLENTDDVVIRPEVVSYDPVTNRALLTFRQDPSNSNRFVDPLTGVSAGPGTFRLRIGADEPLPLPPLHVAPSAEPGSSFDTASAVAGVLGNPANPAGNSILISAAIDAQAFPLDLPGSNDEPGHRDIPEKHVPDGGADQVSGITRIEYNFRSDLGFVADPNNEPQPAFNLITEAQKQRAREVFEILGQVSGIDFVETERDGLIVATGDLRTISPGTTPSAQGGVPGLVGSTAKGLAIVLDAAESWNDNYGAIDGTLPGAQRSWFQVFMQSLDLHLVRQIDPGNTVATLGVTRDLPPLTVSGQDNSQAFDNPLEPVFPGDQAVVHLQHLYRPDSKDIDVFRFEVQSKGKLSLETMAERRANSSLLDTSLALYRDVRDSRGVVVGRELLARNDDYFSNDSFLTLDVEPGTYFAVVTAQGNNDYDPDVEDTGFGGVSQGPYDLRLNFQPQVTDGLVDVDNAGNSAAPANARSTPLDGDADGVPGGVFNFWFRTAAENRTLNFTDAGAAVPDGQTITITNGQGTVRRFEFNKTGGVAAGNIRVDYTDASTATDLAGLLQTAINGQSGFNVTATVSGNSVTLVGDRTVALSTGFRGLKIGGKTIFVDKTAPANGDGSRARPFNNLAGSASVNAVSSALPGDIIRVVGNDQDGNLATLNDRVPYELGFNNLGQALPDGQSLEVPQGVTLMVDAGAVFKLRRARISTGSNQPHVDRSASALQVLGTPFVVNASGQVVKDASGQVVPGSVHFTSYHDETIGRDNFPFTTTPLPGDWGGIQFRDDIDRADGNFLYDEEGIFLNYVNQADIRYGGGSVVVNSVAQVVNPISMIDTRPTLTYNIIRNSSDAALSATPNSFEETNFLAPRHQLVPFTPDYERVGPHIRGNVFQNDTIGGLLVRVDTPAGGDLRKLSVSARWDDTDVVHVLTENLQVVGTPGGPFRETTAPRVDLVIPTSQRGGALPAGTYQYRVAFVDAAGNEGVASVASPAITLGAGFGTIKLDQLPTTSGNFVARRLYRSVDNGPYYLVGELNGFSSSYTDSRALTLNPLGTVANPTLAFPNATTLQRARQDGRLSVDPSMVVKLDGARFEIGFGAQFIAEGGEGREIRFTSLLDDRFGAGGGFDITGDNSLGANEPQPAPGDWGGIYLAPFSAASLDQAVVAYAGGVNRVEGTFVGFNALEVHQADARVTNSVFEFNAEGQGGQGTASAVDRFGRGFNEPAVIFVRGAQPVIANNIIHHNVDVEGDDEIAAISINVNALSHVLKSDPGRVTGLVDQLPGQRGNRGPLIIDNRLADNDLNGMVVRGETLTTESVWDDADIVHILFDTIYVPDFHTYGGLRLESNAKESLVVKLQSQGATSAGITALGRPLEIDDRIGGIVQVIGLPSSPVVFTSLADDTIGAGFQPNGDPQTDTNNNGNLTQPSPGDWRSVRLERFSHDRNAEILSEIELGDVESPGLNATPTNAERLGSLATSEGNSDENLRLGFNVHGFLADNKDRDVYSFTATAGTEVWIELDATSQSLNSVLELIDGEGNVLARSDDSLAESSNPSLLFGDLAKTMQKTPPFQGQDFFATNPRDAGMRLVLPGAVGTLNNYFVRVRSSSQNLDQLDAGLTAGAYELKVRLRETDEVAGSTIRFADMRYASNAIEIAGMPLHSPLLGESGESDDGANNPGGAGQNLGNLLQSDRGTLAVGGSLISRGDVDVYQFGVNYSQTEAGANAFRHPVIFDVDYTDGLGRPNTNLYVFNANGQLILAATDSNIAEDRPDPVNGSNLTNLSRGTVGSLDPYIGAAELQAGQAYFIAVSNNSQVPPDMAQFLTQNPTNPLVRLEPINSVDRVVEDHIGSQGGSTPQNPSTLTPLIDNNSVIPFHFGDVTLFMTQEYGYILGNPFVPDTRMVTVDPFTGTPETVVSNFDPLAFGSYDGDTGDLAMRSDGTYYYFTLGDRITTIDAPNDANSGNLYRINMGDGSTAFLNDDGIFTYEEDPDPMNAGQPIRAHEVLGTRVGYGVQFEAVGFARLADGTERLLAVGRRGDAPSLLDGNIANPAVQLKENILYEFVADNGAGQMGQVVRDANTPTLTDGDRLPSRGNAATDATELGEVFTSPRVTAPEATTYVPRPNQMQSTYNIQDGGASLVSVTHPLGTTVFEFDAGPEVNQQVNHTVNNAGVLTGYLESATVRDGYFFSVDPDRLNSGDEVYYQLDTGSVINVRVGSNAIPDGQTLTIQSPGVGAMNFEFDNDGAQLNAAADPIDISGNLNAAGVAVAIQNAINAAAGLNVTARSTGNRVTLEGESQASVSSGVLGMVTIEGERGDAPILKMVDGSLLDDGQTFQLNTNSTGAIGAATFEFDSGFVFRVPSAGGSAFVDGQTFRVMNLTGTGNRDVTFEFDSNGQVAQGNVPILFSTGDSQDAIASRVASRINAANLNLNPPVAAYTNGVVHVGGAVQQGLPRHAIPSNDSALVLSGLPGSNVGTGFVLQAPAAGGRDLAEIAPPSLPHSFRIQNAVTGADVTFEFDSGYAFTAPTAGGVSFLEIPGSQTFTIANAANGATSTFEFDSGFVLRVPNLGGRAFNDGDRFVVTNGATSVTFEFDDSVNGPNGVAQNNVAIAFNPNNDTQNTVADAIVTAIGGQAALGLTPVNLGGGRVYLGGTAANTINVLQPNALQLFGQPGVAPGNVRIAINAATDNQDTVVNRVVAAIQSQFNALQLTPANLGSGRGFVGGTPSHTITNNSNMIFSGSPGVRPGSVPIIISPATDTANDVANKVSRAILAQPALQLTPSITGTGRISLGGTAAHTLTNNSPMILSGQPGFSNNRLISFVPSATFTANTTATRVAAAIQAASQVPQVFNALPGDQIADGTIFRVTDGGQTVTFEFDDVTNPLGQGSSPGVTPGNVRVPYVRGNPNAQPAAIPPDSAFVVAQRLESAITANTSSLVRVRRNGTVVEVTETGLSTTTFVPTATDWLVVNGQGIQFTAGSSPIRAVTNPNGSAVIQIQLEESDLNDIVAQRVASTVQANGVFNFSASGDGTRLNFPPILPATPRGVNDEADLIDIRGVPVWAQVTSSARGVTQGNVAIPFMARDDSTQIAARIATAINNELSPLVTAAASGRFARLSSGAVTVQNPTGTTNVLIGEGAGPGGIITGMISVPNTPGGTIGTVYAVSDRGGLYRVEFNPFPTSPIRAPNVQVTYIESSADDLLGINFSALTVGPREVEGGRYSQMLFASDVSGRIYAFNTEGRLQPIFNNGATSVATGLNPSGNDPINGLAFSTLDENLWHSTVTRGNQAGHGINSSFDGSRSSSNGGLSMYFGSEGQANGLGYDFPGGAQGTIVTNEFSLVGYLPADQPTLYFNYFSGIQADNTQFDSFRVFIADDSGNWDALAANTGPGQTLHDNSGNWRQARIPLGGYAGRSNLRLRFEFNTGGDSNIGHNETSGEELRAVDGSKLRDGDIIRIDGQAYELDLGFTLVAPGGARIDLNDAFTVDGITYTFVSGPAGANQISIDPTKSAFDVAADMAAVLRANGQRVILQNNRLNLPDAQTASQSGLPTEFLEGSVGVQTGSIAVPVHAGMDRVQVASVFRTVFEGTLTPQVLLALDGSQFVDGDVFTLDDGTNSVTFEFDSGYSLISPAFGGLLTSGGVADGDTFTLSDGGLNDITFEFDKDGSIHPSNQAISFTETDGRLTISRRIEQTLGNLPAAQRAALGIVPSLVPGGVQIVGAPGTTLTINTKSFVSPYFFAFEDNNSLPTASSTGINQRGTGRTSARIGDGTLGTTTGDYDWYRIDDVVEGEIITVDVDAVRRRGGSSLDSIVALYDNAGNLLAINDNDGETTDSFLRLAVPGNGDYFVVVFGGGAVVQTDPQDPNTGSGVASTGPYDISIKVDSGLIAPTPYAPREDDGSLPLANGAVGTPSLINQRGARTVSATIGDGPFGATTGDYDWYRVANVFPGENIVVDVDAVSMAGGSSLDSSIGIYDRNGVLLASNDNDDTTNDSFLTFRATLGGDYYVVVHGSGSNFQTNAQDSGSGAGVGTIGDYEVTITVGARVVSPTITVPREADDMRSLATETGINRRGSVLATGTVGDGAFGLTSGDYDYYVVRNVLAGQMITVDVDAATRRGGSTLNSVVGIYDSTGLLPLAQNDDDGVSSDSYLNFIAPAAGHYYVVVHGGASFASDPDAQGTGSGAGSRGVYDLKITVDQTLISARAFDALEDAPGEDNGSRPSATRTGIVSGGTVIARGNVGDGTFGGTTGDFDWYAVNAATGQFITVDVNAVTLAGGSTLDAAVGIYDDGGNLLATNDDDPNTFDSFLKFRVPTVGNYFVVIQGGMKTFTNSFQSNASRSDSGPGVATRGDYEVVISVESEPTGVVPRTAAEQSNTQDDGSRILAAVTALSGRGAISTTGTIGNGPFGNSTGDYDWYQVRNVQAGQTITVDIDARSLPSGSTLDSSVGIYSATSQLPIATNDDDGQSADSYLRFTAPATGDYYVVVHGFGSFFQSNPGSSSSGPGPGTTGNYEIQIVLDGGGITSDGHTPGVGVGHEPVFFSPSTSFTANETAQELARSINASALGVSGSVTAAVSGRQVILQRPDLIAADLILDSGTTDLRFLEGNVQVVKQHQDLIRIIDHTVTERGPFGLQNTPLPGDLPNTPCLDPAFNYPEYPLGNPFSNDNANCRVGFSSPARGQNNSAEGVYFDDIIIGFAERGELVTSGSNNGGTVPAFVNNPQANANDLLTGPYQLEIRTGTRFLGEPGSSDPAAGARSMDTNDRLADQMSIVAVAAVNLADGQTFTLSDGIRSLTFEYDDASLPFGHPLVGVADGNVRIPFDPTQSEPARVIAQRIRDAINSDDVQAILDISADTDDGYLVGTQVAASTTSRVNLFGPAVVNATTLPNVPSPVTTYSTIAATRFDDSGDSNLFRDQGQLLIHSNRISNASGFGILVNNDLAREGGQGDRPHPGAARNLVELNSNPLWPTGLAPGVVIANNLLASNATGGIRLDGDQNLSGEPAGVASFDRVFNNTIYGGGQGVGIEINNAASPTLLNNVFAQLQVGISASNGAVPIVGASAFQGNGVRTQGVTAGDFVLDLADTAPLFVDAARGNFYPAPLSRIIDSGIGSLQDREDFMRVKSPIGLGYSPILAPQQDVAGLLRMDDPTVEPPMGMGRDGFVDRGAFDRADGAGPSASLVNPRDNDSEGVDLDRSLTVFDSPDGVVLSNFRLRLTDGGEPADASGGTGIDDFTISSAAVQVRQNGRLLQDGIDYSFSYNATSDTLRLTPLSGVWTNDRVYTITLINRDRFTLPAKDGNQINDEDQFTITTSTGETVFFEFDAGYRLVVPQSLTIVVPSQGPGVGGIADGQRFSVGNGQRFRTFEFDSNGATTAGNIAIPFTSSSTVDSIASSIVNALAAAGLGLSPRYLGTGRVHLGSLPVHTLNTALSTLQQQGIPASVIDGESFSIDDGTKVVTFEFDRDGFFTDANNDGIPDNTLIPFTPSQTDAEIARNVSNAIAAANLGLSPSPLTGGDLFVGGELRHIITLAPNSKMTLVGKPGLARTAFGLQIPTVAGNVSGIRDGDLFEIDNNPLDAAPPVVFEFDSDGRTVNPTVVPFVPGGDVDDLADTLAGVIQNANLGLDPVNAGNGQVFLGGTSQHTLRIVAPRADGLKQLGQPGVPAAIAVPVSPVTQFNSTQVAVSVINVINQSNLPGVSASAGGGNLVIVEGANAIADPGEAFTGVSFTGAIRDQAQNGLKANQLSGETLFTITLGEVATDLGDAADLPYPATLGSNGASHVTSPGFYLGSGVDTELDGQPSDSATGDDGDYNLDAFQSTLTTTASSPFTVQIPTAIQVSSNGFGAGGVAEGDVIVLGDARQLISFEFDTDGIVGAGHVALTVSANASADEIADAIVAAVRANRLSLDVNHLGGGSILARVTPMHTLDASQCPAMGITAGLADSETLVISDRIRPPVTFEIDMDGVWTPGNVRVFLTPFDTLDQAADKIVAAVQSVLPDQFQTGGPSPLLTGLTPANLRQGVVYLGGSFTQDIDATGSQLRQYGQPVYLLEVPQTFTLQVASGGGAVMQDGERFTVGDGTRSVTFEFDSNGSTTLGNTPIPFAVASSPAQVGDAIANALRTSGLGLSPVHLGDGRVHLGSRAVHSIATSFAPSLTSSGVAGGVDDGQVLVVNDGLRLVKFEFQEVSGTPTSVQPGNVAINFRLSETRDQIAAAIVNAVTNAGFSQLSVTALSGGQIYVNGTPTHTMDLSSSRMTSATQLPMTLQIPAGGGADLNDGETFMIQKDQQVVRWEFDRDGISTPGNLVIPFATTDGQAELASRLAAAIEGAGLQLRAAATGNGVVQLIADDEDGVTFRGIFNPFVDTEILVTAAGISSRPGYLDAWIDFNRDGDFADEGEQIFQSKQLTDGLNVLTARAPADSKFGPTVARFRLSSQGGLHPTGVAVDGEVEDYQVFIQPGVPPVADDDTRTTNEDTPVSIDVLANDGDADGDPLSITDIDLSGTLGTASVVNGQVVYDPRGAFDSLRVGQTAVDTFRYTVGDGTGALTTAVVTVTITGLNDAPRGVSDNFTLAEDNRLAISEPGVLVNDFDPEGDSFSLGGFDSTSVNGALVTVANSGAFTYDPRNAPNLQRLPEGGSLVDTFTYTLRDGTASSRGTVTVTVTGMNDAPIANSDSGNTNEDTPFVTTNVLSNDSDPDAGDAFGFVSVDATSASGATITDMGNGTFLYDPTTSASLQRLAVGRTQVDTFTYEIGDTNGARTRGTVAVTVSGRNDAPNAQDDTATTLKNASTVINIRANDEDPENDTLQMTLDLTGTKGLVSINANGSVTYNPNGQFNNLTAGQTATDVFRYTLSDGQLSDVATVTVTIRGPNNPPVANPDAEFTFEGSPITINVLTNDSEPDGQGFSVTGINTAGLKGVATLNADGTVTFDPAGQFENLAEGQQSIQTFTYTVTDNDALPASATGTVTVTVIGQNDVPIAANDGYTMFQNGSLITTDVRGSTTPTNQNDNGVLANDVDADGDGLTVTIVTAPRHALTFVMNANGTFTYSHDGSNTTSDTFTYRVSDGHGGAATATATIAITPRPPSAWRNSTNPLDVNADTFVSPIDALLIVNELNRNGSRPLPNPPVAPNAPPPFYDVTGDLVIAPDDVLRVVNFLNTQSGAEGEGAALGGDGSILAVPDFTGPEGSTYGQRLLETLSDAEVPAGVQDGATDFWQQKVVPILLASQARQESLRADELAQFADHDLNDLLEDLVDDLDGAADDEEAADAIFAAWDV